MCRSQAQGGRRCNGSSSRRGSEDAGDGAQRMRSGEWHEGCLEGDEPYEVLASATPPTWPKPEGWDDL